MSRSGIIASVVSVILKGSSTVSFPLRHFDINCNRFPFTLLPWYFKAHSLSLNTLKQREMLKTIHMIYVSFSNYKCVWKCIRIPFTECSAFCFSFLHPTMLFVPFMAFQCFNWKKYEKKKNMNFKFKTLPCSV